MQKNSPIWIVNAKGFYFQFCAPDADQRSEYVTAIIYNRGYSAQSLKIFPDQHSLYSYVCEKCKLHIDEVAHNYLIVSQVSDEWVLFDTRGIPSNIYSDPWNLWRTTNE